MHKLRARFNAGCWLFFAASFILWMVFASINAIIDWVAAGKPASFQPTPFVLTALEVIALLLLGPLLLAALHYVARSGLRRTVAQVATSWLTGLRSGFVCLLFILPYFLIEMVWHPLKNNAATRGSAVLYLLFMAFVLVSAPVWSLLLIRRLPRVVLRGTLFERFSPESFEPGGSQ